MKLVLPFLILALATACSPPIQIDGFPEDLAIQGGCGDLVLFAVDDADTMLLTVTGEGFVAAAEATGEETTSLIDLSQEGLVVRLQTGTEVSAATCTDDIEGNGPVFDTEYEAGSGTATLTVQPAVGGVAEASVLLEGLEFPVGSHALLLERLELADVSLELGGG